MKTWVADNKQKERRTPRSKYSTYQPLRARNRSGISPFAVFWVCALFCWPNLGLWVKCAQRRVFLYYILQLFTLFMREFNAHFIIYKLSPHEPAKSQVTIHQVSIYTLLAKASHKYVKPPRHSEQGVCALRHHLHPVGQGFTWSWEPPRHIKQRVCVLRCMLVIFELNWITSRDSILHNCSLMIL